MIEAPVEKKDYSVGLIRPTKKTEFELLFERYLRLNNCKGFYPIKNKYSRTDYFLTSGFTGAEQSLVIEYKNRNNKSVYQYTSSIIEQDKLKKNLVLASLITSRFMFIVEYSECFCFWLFDLDKKEYDLIEDNLICPVSNDSVETKVKPIFHLLFKDCELVVSKKGYKKADVEQLLHYIKLKRKEIYGEHD